MIQMDATLVFWAMRRNRARILHTRRNESSTGVIVSKDPMWKNLEKPSEKDWKNPLKKTRARFCALVPWNLVVGEAG